MQKTFHRNLIIICFAVIAIPSIASAGNPGKQSAGGVDAKTESSSKCKPDVSAEFSLDRLSVVVSSTKDLSNVVVLFEDGSTQKFDNLSGLEGSFEGTEKNAGKLIDGIWIKSGCNGSDDPNDPPGSGEFVPAPEQPCLRGDPGDLVIGQDPPEGVDCQPKVSALFSCDGLSVATFSTKDLSNVILLFEDGAATKFEELSGLDAIFWGEGEDIGKVIAGVWIKSGCNRSGDGPDYGECLPNPNQMDDPDRKPDEEVIVTVRCVGSSRSGDSE